MGKHQRHIVGLIWMAWKFRKLQVRIKEKNELMTLDFRYCMKAILYKGNLFIIVFVIFSKFKLGIYDSIIYMIPTKKNAYRKWDIRKWYFYFNINLIYFITLKTAAKFRKYINKTIVQFKAILNYICRILIWWIYFHFF